jgi:hypothetical protein
MSRLRLIWLNALAVAFVFASAAEASHVVVPTDVPTVQAGLDSKADTVFLSDGNYNEDVVMRRSLVLSALPVSYRPALPRIGRP